MTTSRLLIALLVAWPLWAAHAETGTISTKQIISTCIQKGSSPCAIGVDKRTITINNVTYSISSKIVAELKEFADQNRQLSLEERKRYANLLDALQRMEAKLGDIDDNVTKLRQLVEENSGLLRESIPNARQVVPNVVGATVDRAKDVLYGKNILVSVKPVTVLRVAFPDIVHEQFPAGGTTVDPRTTTVELRVAEEPKTPDAQFQLATAYEGVRHNFASAAEWYRRAAESGHAPSQYRLGTLYAEGKGVRKDPTAALKYLLAAADQGVAEAQHRIGVLYLREYRGTKDEGIAWLKKAATKGVKESQRLVELVAIEDAARAGNPTAQSRLASMYLIGKDVPVNVERAVALYKGAAEQGDISAQYQMGVLYENGQGVQVNLGKAFGWYKLAAEQGSADAQNNLGVMYMQGRSVPQNIAMSIVWFKVAAARGSEQARTNLNLSTQLVLSASEVERINKLAREYGERYAGSRHGPRE